MEERFALRARGYYYSVVAGVTRALNRKLSSRFRGVTHAPASPRSWKTSGRGCSPLSVRRWTFRGVKAFPPRTTTVCEVRKGAEHQEPGSEVNADPYVSRAFALYGCSCSPIRFPASLFTLPIPISWSRFLLLSPSKALHKQIVKF